MAARRMLGLSITKRLSFEISAAPPSTTTRPSAINWIGGMGDAEILLDGDLDEANSQSQRDCQRDVAGQHDNDEEERVRQKIEKQMLQCDLHGRDLRGIRPAARQR